MEGGSVVQVGDPHEIARNPATDYVRAFFRGVDLTRHLTVGDIARTDQVPIFPVPSNIPDEFGAAIEHLRSIKRHYGFLVDPAHRLIGVVSIDSLLRCLGQSRPDLAGALLDHVPALAGASPFREVWAGRQKSAPVPGDRRQGDLHGGRDPDHSARAPVR